MTSLDKLAKITAELRNHKAQPAAPDDHDRLQIINKNGKRILIKNAPFLLNCGPDDHLQIRRGASIGVDGDTIAAVGPEKKIKFPKPDMIYDAGKRGGIVITPGLINTHSHIHMYLMRSAMMLDEGESIDQTIAAMPIWQKLESDADMSIAAIGDLTEQQKSGVTATLTHGPSFASAETAARATGQNLINAVSAISSSRPDNSPEMVAEILAQKKHYQSIPAVAIHYLYKAEPEQLANIKIIAEKHSALVTFHMAESAGVARQNQKTHKLRETAFLKKLGLLNSNSLASHVVHVNNNEIQKIVASGMGVSHLPTSNVSHKSGTFKYWQFHDCGGFTHISLGTDSVVSKSRLDILSEAYQTRLSHIYERTVKFSSLFKMMTINGARVLGLPDRGKILPGYKADIAFWKLKDRGFIPYDQDNPLTLIGNIITHGGRLVRDLMINGRFVVSGRRHLLVDESLLLEKIQKAHTRVRARVG